LCAMGRCGEVFHTVFPEQDLEAECGMINFAEECKLGLRAGPLMIPINLGWVTADCCAAARACSNSKVDSVDSALDGICGDACCIAAYKHLFQKGQAITNPGSTGTLAAVCKRSKTTHEVSAKTKGSSDKDGLEILGLTILTIILAFVMMFMVATELVRP